MFLALKFMTVLKWKKLSPPPWRCGPTRTMASSFLRFLDHIKRRTTVGRIPLDEWSARCRDLYLTIHNTHNRQTSMPPWEKSEDYCIKFVIKLAIVSCIEGFFVVFTTEQFDGQLLFLLTFRCVVTCKEITNPFSCLHLQICVEIVFFTYLYISERRLRPVAS
jgi:hypothetical protein